MEQILQETHQVLSDLQGLAAECRRIQDARPMPPPEKACDDVLDQLKKEKVVADAASAAVAVREEVAMDKMRTAYNALAAIVKGNSRFFDEEGAEIPTKLAGVLTKHGEVGPLHPEDDLVGNYVETFVLKFFQKLIKDDGCLTQEWTHANDQVQQLMLEVRQLSLDLGDPGILPERLDKEDGRCKKVDEMWKHYAHRRAAVDKEDTVQPSIQRKWAEFLEQVLAEMQHRDEEAAQRKAEAEESAEKACKMRAAEARKVRENEQATELRKSRCRSMKAQLQETLQEVKKKLEQAERLSKEILEEGHHQQEADKELQFCRDILQQRIAHEEVCSKLSLTSAEQMRKGRAVLKDFQAWLQQTYGWMQRSLQQKREQMEKDVAEDGVKYLELLRELQSDNNRRLQASEATKKQTQKKLLMAVEEARRLERVPRQQRKTKKQQAIVADLQQQLRDIQTYQTKLSEFSQTIEAKIEAHQRGKDGRLVKYSSAAIKHATAWTKKIFFNSIQDSSSSEESGESDPEPPRSWLGSLNPFQPRRRIPSKRPPPTGTAISSPKRQRHAAALQDTPALPAMGSQDSLSTGGQHPAARVPVQVDLEELAGEGEEETDSS